MAEHNNNNGRKEVNKVGIIACVVVAVLVAVIVILVVFLMKRQEPDVPNVPSSEQGEVGIGKIGNGETDESTPSDSSDAEERNEYGENLFVSMDSSEWYFPSATEASTNAVVANSELNHCDIYFEVTVDSTQELVYRSQVLTPGDTLTGIVLGKELESGTYPCTLVYRLVNSDTGEEYEDNVVLGISITIQ